MENRQLQQLVIILKRKEAMLLLTDGTFRKGTLTRRKRLRYFRRYTMNEVVSKRNTPLVRRRNDLKCLYGSAFLLK